MKSEVLSLVDVGGEYLIQVVESSNAFTVLYYTQSGDAVSAGSPLLDAFDCTSEMLERAFFKHYASHWKQWIAFLEPRVDGATLDRVLTLLAEHKFIDLL